MINLSSYLFNHLLETLGGNIESLKNVLSLDKAGLLKGLNFSQRPIGQPYSQKGEFTIPPYKDSVFYKKWKLMSPEEQGLWHDKNLNKYEK